MLTFLASLLVFLIVFFCLALGTLRKKPCRECSCKMAARIMDNAQTGACRQKLYQLDGGPNT